ncbi:MAG: bilirubin oxidase [Massilia sp.]|nr:bilirubin oxidase [Massilia sp.]
MDVPPANDGLDPSRRKLLKGGAYAGTLAAAYGWLSPGTGTAQTATPAPSPAPYLEPFLDPLPVSPVKSPTLLYPRPGRLPVPGEAGREPHQRYEEFLPQREYELVARAARHRYHLHLPEETVWGYDGLVPGPTFVTRIGQPVMVRVRNALPQEHVGFGSPEIITHLHSGHVGSAADGFTGSYYSPIKAGPNLRYPGAFYDHHYPQHPSNGDLRKVTNTLWYHDHREDYTGPNVYRGLAGFYLTFDALDSGSEHTGLRLPSGVGRYDIPLLLQDRKFDSGGNLVYEQFDPEGFLGNHFLVNGKVQPYFRVEGRKYRFRLLNGSMARWFEMVLADEGNRFHNFTFIGSDGNLLERPLTLQKILLSMAERADIIIDFSKYPPGTKLYLLNRLEQNDPGNRAATASIRASACCASRSGRARPTTA